MKNWIISILLIGLLSSCIGRPVPIELHKGNVLVEKGIYDGGNQCIIIKCKDSIYKITVTVYDSDRFNIGDTIK